MSAQRAGRVLLGLAVAALIAFPILSDNLYLQNMLILTFLLAIGATSWNVMGGYAGYLSLGSSVFIGLGGYTTGILAADHGVSPFVGCFVGGLVAGVAAAALSLVTRRTRGMYFVIVTFAALELCGLAVRNLGNLTGGSAGLALPIPMWDLAYQNWPFYYGLLAVLAAAIGTSALIRRGKLGMGLFAIQDDEDKASGLGVNTALYKLVAFVAGSVFLGTAGGLYAYYLTFLDPSAMFDIVASVLMVLAALIGGRGTLWGPVLGAFILEPLAELTNTGLGGADAGALRLILFGTLLGAVVLFLPRGILPSLALRRARGTRPSWDTAPAGPIPVSSGTPSRGARRTDDTVLTTHALSRSFGGVRAVSDVDLRLGRGLVTGLVGPNGSGKTTLFNLVDGTIPASSGSVELDGRQLSGSGRLLRAHAGIGRTYQLPRLFESLTVLENVVLPERSTRPARWLRTRVPDDEQAVALGRLAHLGLGGYADASPADLSYGQRKLVELAQVLALEPDVVLLDEPAAGISPAMTERLVGLVQEANANGTSFLVVEHDLTFVSSLCDHVYVMAAGELIASGTVAEISHNETVVDAYLGDVVSLGVGQ